MWKNLYKKNQVGHVAVLTQCPKFSASTAPGQIQMKSHETVIFNIVHEVYQIHLHWSHVQLSKYLQCELSIVPGEYIIIYLLIIF